MCLPKSARSTKERMQWCIPYRMIHQRNLKRLGNQQSSWWGIINSTKYREQTNNLSSFHSNQKVGRYSTTRIVMLLEFSSKLGMPSKLCHMYLPFGHITQLNWSTLLPHSSLWHGNPLNYDTLLEATCPVQGVYSMVLFGPGPCDSGEMPCQCHKYKYKYVRTKVLNISWRGMAKQ